MENIILQEQTGNVLTLWLNHPESRNALSPSMVSALTNALKQATCNASVRIIVLRGKDKGFCSGASLNSFTQTERPLVMEQSVALANLFNQIYLMPKPVVSVVHGFAMGGANGLIAASDYTISASSTTFAFSEVKLGVIPATIMPFLAKRLTEGKLRELVLTAKPFSAAEAAQFGLIAQSTPDDEVDAELERVISHLLSGGPKAQALSKELIAYVTQHSPSPDYTAKMLANVRLSAEAQEGVSAFLEKRKANFNLG